MELVDEKDTFSLRSCGRLHDPRLVWLSSEFILEDRVIARQDVSHRNDLHVDEISRCIFFSQRIAFFLHFSPEAFDVLHHQVLPGQLEVIREVVQYL